MNAQFYTPPLRPEIIRAPGNITFWNFILDQQLWNYRIWILILPTESSSLIVIRNLTNVDSTETVCTASQKMMRILGTRGVYRIFQRWVRARSARKIFFAPGCETGPHPPFRTISHPPPFSHSSFFGPTSKIFFSHPGAKLLRTHPFLHQLPGGKLLLLALLRG